MIRDLRVADKALGNNGEAVGNSACQEVEDENVRIRESYSQEGASEVDTER